MSVKNTQNELTAFIKDNINADVSQLLLKGHPSVNVAYAVEQIIARRKLKNKLEDWSSDFGLTMPPPISVEQASSAETAQFKSTLLKGPVMADLTGGLGIDTYFFAQQHKTVHYVDKNAELCSIAQQNFSKMGIENIMVHNTTAENFVRNYGTGIDSFYLDPSRRSGNKKVFKIEDYVPNIEDLLPSLLKKTYGEVLIKTSPLLDIASSISTLKQVQHVYVVAVKNECKEVLYFLNGEKGIKSSPKVTCVNLLSGQPAFSFQFEDEKRVQVSCKHPSGYAYLYEPNAAILKSGAFKLLCEGYQVHKAHPSTHLYFGNNLLKNFPGRVFQIKAILPPKVRNLKNVFQGDRANISVRNFPLSVNQLKSKLKLKDGGGTYIFACTVVPKDKILIVCDKVNP